MTFDDSIGRSRKRDPVIKIHGAEAFAAMHKAGRLTAAGLDMLGDYVRPGVTTQRLDDLAYQFAMDNGAYPATLFYRGYTKSICTSINHVVCHGIPDDKPLREGDVLNIDYTLIVDGWHGDSSRMYGVGEISRKAERLIEITYESLLRGIRAVRAGATTGDIGFAIQRYAEAERCSVVRDFCGHGVGQLFHDAPNILHYGSPGEGPELKAGMIFTIEPILVHGSRRMHVWQDGWTAATLDGGLGAQFEHEVLITEDGCEVLTVAA